MYSHGSLKYICQTDTFLTLSSLLLDKNKFFTCCYSIVSNLLWHMLGKGTVPKLTSVYNQIWTKRCKEIKEGVSCCSSHKQLSTTSTQLRMNWVDNTRVDETEADKLGYCLIFHLWWEAMLDTAHGKYSSNTWQGPSTPLAMDWTNHMTT